MAREPKHIVGAIESRGDGISVTMRRAEAMALVTVSETGLAVSEALRLITNSATAERALKELRGAVGRGATVTITLRRPEGAALIHVSEVGLSVTRALAILEDLVNVTDAQRGLEELRGAMR